MKKTDCPSCRGTGTIKCDDCGGIGTIHLPAGTLGEWQTLPLPRPCGQCEGDGKIDCPRCMGTGAN
jgi:DnaJ-class molecular chaperone